MKRKIRKFNGRLTAVFVALSVLLPAHVAAASPATVSATVSVIRPDEHTLGVLTVVSVHNETDASLPVVQLPLPNGYTDVSFAVAPNPEQLTVDGLTAMDPSPLAPGESRQYVYRATVPLPEGGTRLQMTLPWAATDVIVLIDSEALQALPGPEFADAGTLDLEGRTLTGYRLEHLAAGETVSIAVGPGRTLTEVGPGERPSRWERLQANLGGRPAAFLTLAAAIGLAVWATVAWRQQRFAPARLAAERDALVRRIARLDLLAAGTEGPPPGYEAERERLFAALERIARELGREQR